MKVKLTLETAKALYKEGGAGKSFALDNFTEKELTENVIEKWEDLGKISGYYIEDGAVLFYDTLEKADFYRDIFATKELAESSLAKAQLSQLLKEFNGDWVADWSDKNQMKYSVSRKNNNVLIDFWYDTYQYLAFETKEKRDKFYELHEELIHTYLMID